MSNDLKKAIKLAEKATEGIEPGGSIITEQLQKSHVKGYTRTTASGATVQVKEHEDSRQKKLTEIAQKHLHMPTLEERKSDRHDFKEHTPWGLKDALMAAHAAGGGKLTDRTQMEMQDIAKKHLGRDFVVHNSDREDFKEHHVNDINQALNAAYEHGAKSASPKKPKKTEKPLPTNNEGYGYHGEAYTAHEGHVQYQEQGAGADTHFAEAAKHVMKYGGVGAEDARNYLDSRYGRHLHDEVQNFTSQHVGRPKDVEKGHHPDTIKKYIGPAIKEHFQRKYSQRLLSDVVKNRESFK
jgi:hypothetical protein